MGWIQRNIGLILFIAGVCVAIMLFRGTQINQCVSDGTRAAFVASFADNAAGARRADGNENVADFYEAVALGLLDRLPRTNGAEPQDLGQVVQVQRGDHTAVELTPKSMKAILDGCSDAYTPF